MAKDKAIGANEAEAKMEKEEVRKAAKIVVVKAAFKQKQKVGLTGQKMLPMKNAVKRWIVTNSEIYHQKYRKL